MVQTNITTDRHVIKDCQIRHFSQEADSDFKVQIGPSVICIDSGPKESQGYLCKVENITIVTDTCSTISLQYPTTKGSSISCPDKQPENLGFEFSCQVRKADEGAERSCKCLGAQQFWVEDYLKRNDNPFVKNLHQSGIEVPWRQEPEQMRYLPQKKIEVYSSEPTTTLTLTKTQTVTEVVGLDTVLADEPDMISAAVPGFYIIPRSLQRGKSDEAPGGNANGIGPVRKLSSKAPQIKRFTLQAKHIFGKSSQLGRIHKSLKSRALGWVDVEYHSCMTKACDQNEYGKKPDKVCSDNLTSVDKLTRQNCKMCSPINPQMLAEHCRQLVNKEQVAIFTVCGMAVLLVLIALGLVALRRWRRLKEIRKMENETVLETLQGDATKKPWYRLSRNSGARKISGTNQAETGGSPENLTKAQPLVDGTPAMCERVPIMPHAHARGSSVDGICTGNRFKETADTTAAAISVIPHIRITSTGSQHGTWRTLVQRKSAHDSDLPDLPGRGGLDD